jgi:hypothetical protein
MIVSIYPIPHGKPVLGVLEKDGWQLDPGCKDHVDARHPQVKDEFSARSRLCRLGLLTSASLRISFRKEPARPPARAS